MASKQRRNFRFANCDFAIEKRGSDRNSQKSQNRNYPKRPNKIGLGISGGINRIGELSVTASRQSFSSFF
jgi:hypothetical protein